MALIENDDDFVPMKIRNLLSLDWKLTYFCGENSGELYDRRNDPDEMINLWSDPACSHVKSGLMGMLMEEVMCSFDVANGRVQQPSPPARKWISRHNS